MANDGEIVGILERNGVEVRHREFRCVRDKFTVGEEILARAVENATVLGFARVATDVPACGRGRNEHFACGRGRNEHFTCRRARTAHRQPGARDAAAAAGTVVINFRICWRLLDLHTLPIQAQLFRQDHGERRHDALAHLGLTKNQRDVVVRSDTDPGVEWIGSLLFLVRRLIGKSARREMEADDEGDAARATGLQKITTVYDRSIRHGTPRDVLRSVRLSANQAADLVLPACMDAARWMALRMRWEVLPAP